MKPTLLGCLIILSAAAVAAPLEAQLQRRQELEHTPDFPAEWGVPPGWGDMPFKGFKGCDSKKKSDIGKAWEDVKILLDATHDRGKWGPLEKRWFGNDIGDKLEVTRRDEIESNLNNAEALKQNTHEIPVQCGGPQCTTTMGAYVIQTVGKKWSATVVLCDEFFKPNRKFLDDIRKDHKKQGWNQGKRHLAGKGRILLHEIMHIHGVSPPSGVVTVVDVEIDGKYAYDWQACETFALLRYDEDGDLEQYQPAWSMVRNADTYALYAVEKWYHGYSNEIPPSAAERESRNEPKPKEEPKPKKEPKGPTKQVTILYEQTAFPWKMRHPTDWGRWKWLFFSTEYGRDVFCKTDPPFVAEIPSNIRGINKHEEKIPGGVTVDVKTQDGNCQYKNDNQGNAGALWCGDTQHLCRFPDLPERVACGSKLMSPEGGILTQEVAIICEW